MKSDVIRVTNAGKGIEEALEAASASARYRELGKKEALHLRLLAEEMLGMVRQITGDAEAEFWTESDELEKSIVANIADEVKIAITGNDVELTVYKDFKN